MDDDTPREVIQQRFDRLWISCRRASFRRTKGDLQSVDVLVEGASKRDEPAGRQESEEPDRPRASAPAGVRAEDLAGSTVRVRVDEAKAVSPAIVDGPMLRTGADPTGGGHRIR